MLRLDVYRTIGLHVKAGFLCCMVTCCSMWKLVGLYYIMNLRTIAIKCIIIILSLNDKVKGRHLYTATYMNMTSSGLQCEVAY